MPRVAEGVPRRWAGRLKHLVIRFDNLDLYKGHGIAEYVIGDAHRRPPSVYITLGLEYPITGASRFPPRGFLRIALAIWSYTCGVRGRALSLCGNGGSLSLPFATAPRSTHRGLRAINLEADRPAS